MEKPKEPVEVEILDVRDVITYPRPGEPVTTHIITYRYGDLPPRTVFIAAREDTPQNRAKIIREDLEKARVFKPEKIKV